MKAAFHTLGCKTNSYETQAMTEQFEKAGFEITAFSDYADLYVINTCSVTAEAARKSRQMLHRCKGKNPDAVVVACGCFAQEAKEELCRDGAVDLVVGNNEKSRILNLAAERLGQKEAEKKGKETIVSEAGALSADVSASERITSPESVLVDDLSRCTRFEKQSITNAGTHVRAYVKIQDGCNRFCSYCIIPFLRGRSRSRNTDEILQEVRTLAGNGIREIVLTGIDISDFRPVPADASDAPAKTAEVRSALAELILKMEETEGIERMRLGSLEAGLISETFLHQIRDSRKLCPHFHLSLQSGCNTVLKRMNRHYSTEEFFESLCMLRECFDDPAVTTDVIAGFPGETEEEFAQTLEFVQKAGFAEMHIFPYSRRKGTQADRMDGQLSKVEKAKRAAKLIERGVQLQQAFMERRLGKTAEILTEETVNINGQDFLVGFTPEYIRAAVPAEMEKINKIVTICPQQIICEGKEKLLI